MKPAIPKGTRDFLPDQLYKRQYIFDTIRATFARYGFSPIETPAMERLDTLTGKYGAEGDQLLFKILNNGDFLSKADSDALARADSRSVLSDISKRGLRYDLTVPFARFVVMHQNEIKFPFKRYQIQPVWRADRPQKGRYQEFYQCDADVVGSDSLVYEAELICIFDEVFSKLGIQVEIQVNNRKILQGLAEHFGLEDKFVQMVTTLDKLDKMPQDKIIQELEQIGLSGEEAEDLLNIISFDSLTDITAKIGDTKSGQQGIEELHSFHQYFDQIEHSQSVVFKPSLARGLSYYTGCIFEVKAKDVQMGSIASGGRYADLTGIFGLKDVSGVGISFGAERIYDVMEELDLFDDTINEDVALIFLAFDQASHEYAFRQCQNIRKAGIAADIYPAPVKLKKQMKYVNDRQIRHAVIIGDEEMNTGLLTMKDMKTGTQEKLDIQAIIQKLKA